MHSCLYAVENAHLLPQPSEIVNDFSLKHLKRKHKCTFCLHFLPSTCSPIPGSCPPTGSPIPFFWTALQDPTLHTPMALSGFSNTSLLLYPLPAPVPLSPPSLQILGFPEFGPRLTTFLTTWSSKIPAHSSAPSNLPCR